MLPNLLLFQDNRGDGHREIITLQPTLRVRSLFQAAVFDFVCDRWWFLLYRDTKTDKACWSCCLLLVLVSEADVHAIVIVA